MGGKIQESYKKLILKLRSLKKTKKTHKNIVQKKDIPKDNKLQRIISKENKDIIRYADFLSELGDNHEQKRGVVSEHDRILVLAGAGSGKTKVLTKRFIHLVENKKIQMSNIVALTFTKEARNEMRQRIAKSLNISTDKVNNVRTFHAFALWILRKNEQFEIITEDQQREVIERIVPQIIKDAELMQAVYNYVKDNIIEHVKNLEPKTNWIKDKPEDFGTKRFNTKSGEIVRSKSERDIANFLTDNGIEWEYEKQTNWSDSAFKPDFTLPNDVYIEHWCYDINSPEIPQINKNKYLQYRQWKEEQFKKHRKTLISLEEREMLDWQQVQIKLKELIEKYTSQKVQLKETFEILQLTELNKKSYDKFIDDIQEIINLAKSRFLTPIEVQKLAKASTKQKITDFYKVLVPVFETYNRTLKELGKGYKDFNDLIKDATILLEKNKEMREYYQQRLEYVLIDEFQDVSYGEVRLLKSILTKKTNLFVVGDDWQSIYGWRGSDVNYILNFEKEFSQSERIILPINYRSKKAIVEASSHFIQLTAHLTRKSISASKENSTDSTKILQVNAENDFGGAKYVIYKIKAMMSKNPELKLTDFLVLYRSSRNLKLYNDTFRQADIKIQKHTIHWSKGTECRYVFILGLKGGMYGFPNTYVDRDIKRIIVDTSIQEKEDEERRIMYVAMTRAKERLFLISERYNESEYTKDIPEEYKFVYQDTTEDSSSNK